MKFYSKVRDFKDTHHKIFRRYKHAGFPLKLGFKSGMPLPFTDTKYDFYSMILIGNDPFRDVMPLPYSDKIIESYKILIYALQHKIKDIVENKIESIVRRTDGILPQKSYSPPNTFTKEQLSTIFSTISDFNTKLPIRAQSNTYKFPMKTDLKEMKWYIDLERNMVEWKKIKDIEECQSGSQK